MVAAQFRVPRSLGHELCNAHPMAKSSAQVGSTSVLFNVKEFSVASFRVRGRLLGLKIHTTTQGSVGNWSEARIGSA